MKVTRLLLPLIGAIPPQHYPKMASARRRDPVLDLTSSPTVLDPINPIVRLLRLLPLPCPATPVQCLRRTIPCLAVWLWHPCHAIITWRMSPIFGDTRRETRPRDKVGLASPTSSASIMPIPHVGG